ncbi:SpoIIE family protein phosphatase [Bacillus sp. 31A1R]|uniref:SpoIIE family protein phosphatase n=1 Tax=Robertmurraya mangrovi TaxID=3098077 RepID=A0ABU5J2L7_9BACI|nr:SpoIIE family protein phosphatase [Bacillus sp. 31A1R]MDZ5473649.1 SpoIIE family protein phosphatase [Bacillus sp. 31A1R]
MDSILNHAPCGFLSVDDEGVILAINQTLLNILGYELKELKGKNINTVLAVPAKAFYQFYFFPLIKLEKKVEEMYLSLLTREGNEIPVLLNATRRENINDCVFIPMYKRNEYEIEILKSKKMAEEALDAKDKANDELRKVLHTLEAKQKELVELNFKNQEYQDRLSKELKLAKNIQEKSLPTPLRNEHINFTSFYKSSTELSGDIYGLYQIDKHRYGVIILDVMGHGISSALVTMSLQSIFQKLISVGVPVDVVMHELDEHLLLLFQNDNLISHYCTVIYMMIDTEKEEIEYINAGHPSAIWLDQEGEMLEFRSTTTPLGLLEGMEFEKHVFSYKKGGRLFLYTDGVTDTVELKVLKEILQESRSKSVEDVRKLIIKALKCEEKHIENIDDQCFILVDIK